MAKHGQREQKTGNCSSGKRTNPRPSPASKPTATESSPWLGPTNHTVSLAEEINELRSGAEPSYSTNGPSRARKKSGAWSMALAPCSSERPRARHSLLPPSKQVAACAVPLHSMRTPAVAMHPSGCRRKRLGFPQVGTGASGPGHLQARKSFPFARTRVRFTGWSAMAPTCGPPAGTKPSRHGGSTTWPLSEKSPTAKVEARAPLMPSPAARSRNLQRCCSAATTALAGFSPIDLSNPQGRPRVAQARHSLLKRVSNRKIHETRTADWGAATSAPDAFGA